MAATKALFDPFDGLRQDQLDKARARNAQRDVADRAAGFAAPGDTSLGSWARTAMSALAAGIEMGDMDSLYEALAMLQNIEAKLRRE